jgi:hypothetical protein
VIFPDGFGASVGAAVGAAVSIVGGCVGAAVGAIIGAAVSIVGGCVVAAVGTSVAGVPQAVNTIVKTIKPTKILNIFVFMFSSFFVDCLCYNSLEAQVLFCFFKIRRASFEVPFRDPKLENWHFIFNFLSFSISTSSP